MPWRSAVRIVGLGIAAALAITALSAGSGGWRLGVQTTGLLAFWAVPTLVDNVIGRGIGFVCAGALTVSAVPVGWASPATVSTIAVMTVAALAIAGDESRRRTAPAPLVRRVPTIGLWSMLSLGGIYACVPETDHIRWLVAAIAVAVIAECVIGEPLVAHLCLVSVGMLGWAALYGGHFRDGAMVGALGSFGLLIIEPIMARVAQRATRLRDAPWLIVTLLVQGAGCLALGRLAGLDHDVQPALLTAAAIVAAMIIACWIAGAPSADAA